MTTNGEWARLTIFKNSRILRYNALQFHIHAPSEHQINGVYYDAEIHIVFKIDPSYERRNDKYELAVVGLLLDSTLDQENDFINEWNLNRNSGEEFFLDFEYFKDLQRDFYFREYFNYEGSLTTPDCNEIVNWFVMRQPLVISKR